MLFQTIFSWYRMSYYIIEFLLHPFQFPFNLNFSKSNVARRNVFLCFDVLSSKTVHFFSNLKSLNMLWITWRRYFGRHFEIGFDSLVCEDSEDCTLISACCPSLCMHAYGETRSQHVFTSYGPVSSITPNYVIFYSWTWGPDRKALLVVIKKELAEINGICSWKKSWRLADT